MLVRDNGEMGRGMEQGKTLESGVTIFMVTDLSTSTIGH